jgi:microcystin degradation protein MlrC
VRILIAQMSHETNTFSPVPTPLVRFSRGEAQPPEGEQALALLRGTGTCVGGYIAACEAAGAQIDMGIAAAAPPSGAVDDEAFDAMCAKIVGAVEPHHDAVMLDLHGAMVTQSHEDGEGELLRRLRAAHVDVPVCVALDMHANLYEDIVALSNIITGYHTYPHVDTYETAKRAGELLLATLRGKHTPVMVWGHLPMLPHIMRQGTDDFPNQQLQARAAQMEEQGALSVALFTGFPHADISNAGLSVVVVSDGDDKQALAWRDELLDQAWREREAFVYKLEPLSESVARAKVAAQQAGDGPVILLDHYDNTASGGTMDTTEVLAEILAQDLDDVAAFGIYDPDAVAAMIAAGVGAHIEIEVGGKTPMPLIPRQSKPLALRGIVKLVSDGRFTATGPMNRGAQMQMGRCAVLDTGKVEVVIVSRHVEPFDPGCFNSVGIIPERKRFVMLKSRIHYRAGFKNMVREIVECAGVGVCTSDYSELDFKHVHRPVYPLDQINTADWRDLLKT